MHLSVFPRYAVSGVAWLLMLALWVAYVPRAHGDPPKPPPIKAASPNPTVGGGTRTGVATATATAPGTNNGAASDSSEPAINNPNVKPPPISFPLKEAAFIIVHAAFSHTEVLINSQPYPQRSRVGAVVRGGTNRVHEVVVKDMKNNATKTYHLRLRPGDAHVLVVDFSEGNMPSVPPKTGGNVPPKPDKADEKSEPSGDMGFITINSKPEARVYIDGKMVSDTTPLNRYKLPSGSHTVRVFYTGTNEFSETRRASITADRHISLHFQQPQKK